MDNTEKSAGKLEIPFLLTTYRNASCLTAVYWI